MSAAIFRDTVIKNQKKDKFWLEIHTKINEMLTNEGGNQRD